MGKKRVTFFISEEVLKELDEVYARLLLKGIKIPKSQIVEEALREKLEEMKKKRVKKS